MRSKGFQAVGLWHAEHWLATLTCPAGFVFSWQEAQSVAFAAA
jgi:hypothetical protein